MDETAQPGKKLQRGFRSHRKPNVPNWVFHITQQAAGRELLFREERDYSSKLVLLKGICDKYALRLYGFCLAPDHVDLLLSPKRANLNDAMRNLFSLYASRYNKKYNRRGHLFGGRYQQSTCPDNGYILAASLYIHLYPVNAGLTRDPLQYRWSSCKFFAIDDPPLALVDTESILGLLADGDMKEGKRRYRELLKAAGRFKAANPQGVDGVEALRFYLGDVFPSLLNALDQREGPAGPPDPEILGLEELRERIYALRSAGLPNSKETRDAKRYLISQLVARGYKQQRIAELLGVSRKTVYNLLKSSG